MSNRAKGFILFDAMLSASVLVMVSTFVTVGIVWQNRLQSQMSERLEALNYACWAAENIMVNTAFNALDAGEYDESVVKMLGAYPGYFKKPGNTLKYNISEFAAGGNLNAKKAEIVVSWRDRYVKGVTRKQSIFVLLSLREAAGA